MNETIKISCGITPTDASSPLGLEIAINDQIIFDSEAVTQAQDFSYQITLPENQEHSLQIRLKNKTPSHTKIDQNGEIVSDSNMRIENLCFDEMPLGQIVPESAIYNHDFNGNGPASQEKFYDIMGCNGTVTLKFTTPIYLWFLENM